MITVVWIYFFLPEIKNRTLEEVDEMFEAKLPARKFRGYVSVGRHLSEEKILSERDNVEEKDQKNQKGVAKTTVHVE